MTKIMTHRSDCPISYSLDLFGDKWSLLVMRDILFFSRCRFRDFAPSERIATNILSDRLERLEGFGLITKERDAKLKNQFIYQATEKGWQLLPIIIEMMLWGFQNDPNTPASKEYVARIKHEKDLLISEIVEAIKQGRTTEYRRDTIGLNI